MPCFTPPVFFNATNDYVVCGIKKKAIDVVGACVAKLAIGIFAVACHALRRLKLT
jgi:hypothetical protein